jgi:hypothetical protein
MVSVLDSSVIDHGLQTNCIGGVIISVLYSSVIDHGLQKNCIGDVMISVFDSSNPRSIILESSTLTITSSMQFFCNP